MGAEVIEVVERRRRWSSDEKVAVLMDALQPGASITAVADRHGVSRNLVYTWLRLAREGRLRGISLGTPPAAAFAPVKVMPEVAAISVSCALSGSEPPRVPHAPRRRPSVIEIVLRNGRIVKVDEGIDAQVLAGIVAALDGDDR